MLHPLALTTEDTARLFARGGITYIAPRSAPGSPKPAKTPEELAAQAERLRAAGACGGAPLSATTPAILRRGWRLVKERGMKPIAAAKILGVQRATLCHHLRGPSRAMRAAIGQLPAP
jgi:hypothetical protein